jgi:AcrR family transcriptional regulator
MAQFRPRRFLTPNVHERIHAATAAVVARAGYEQASVKEICRLADVSPETFAEHFADKRQAVLSAVEAAADSVMGACHAAVAGARSWPEAVWLAALAFTDWGASEPDFCSLALIELVKAGPQADELLCSLVDAFCLFLAPGYELAGGSLPAGSLDAAIGADLLALLRKHMRKDCAQTLPQLAPTLVRVALAPFLGAAEAQRFVAEAKRRRRR